MDNRSKKMVLISHCLCNTNSKVCGFSPQSCSEQSLLAQLFSKGYGIIQLPCPENRVYGSRRWGQSREQFNNPHFKRECTNMLLPFIDEIKDYLENGYDVAAVISVLGSPSCGYKASYSNDSYGGELDFETVESQISSGKVSELSGIFMTELDNLFEEHRIKIPFLDFNEENPEESLQSILSMLG